jgi:hypothetical protein
MDEIPHTHQLPIAQAPPASHPRPAPEFLREHLPRNAAAEDKQNSGETRAIGHARPSAFRPTRWSWQERFDKIPQRLWKQRSGHTRSRYLGDEDQVSAVLLHALSPSQDVGELVVRCSPSAAFERSVNGGSRALELRSPAGSLARAPQFSDPSSASHGQSRRLIVRFCFYFDAEEMPVPSVLAHRADGSATGRRDAACLPFIRHDAVFGAPAFPVGSSAFQRTTSIPGPAQA